MIGPKPILFSKTYTSSFLIDLIEKNQIKILSEQNDILATKQEDNVVNEKRDWQRAENEKKKSNQLILPLTYSWMLNDRRKIIK